jgi:hypothetical protein
MPALVAGISILVAMNRDRRDKPGDEEEAAFTPRQLLLQHSVTTLKRR